MASTIARGQISFIDLNDGKNLSLYLVSNRPLTQLYDVDTHEYAPDYSTDNLVITPNLFVSGQSGNRMSDVSGAPTWTINGSPISSFTHGVSVSSSAPYAMTISENGIVDSNFMTIQCTVNYADPSTTLITPATAQITITKTDTTGELIRAIAYSQDQTIFYNVATTGAQTITLHCDMWRGASIDNTNVTYQWFRKDDPDGADAYDWHKIVNAYSGTAGAAATGTLPDGSTWKEVLKHGITGYNTDDIVITNEDVLNYDAFMCLCTDTDSTSATYNTSVRSDAITILDWSDPITLDFQSPAGTTMTSGTQSLTTTVSVWQGGEELPTSVQNAYYYVWTKANKLGVVATGIKVPGSAQVDPDDYKAGANSVGGNPPVADSAWERRTMGSDTIYCRYSTGATARSIQVYKDEISVKATFFVEVIIP